MWLCEWRENCFPSGMSKLQQQFHAFQPVAEALCGALGSEVQKLGFPQGSVTINGPERAVYQLVRDPAAGADTLLGEWRDAQGQRIGMLVLHADGSFFAEHDVVRAHPQDRRLFVEAVHAWGRDGRISAEPRLMPMAA